MGGRSGLYRSAEISRGRGVPIAFRYELYPVVERRSLRRLIGTKLPRRRLPSVSGRESKRRKLLWPLSQTKATDASGATARIPPRIDE